MLHQSGKKIARTLVCAQDVSVHADHEDVAGGADGHGRGRRPHSPHILAVTTLHVQGDQISTRGLLSYEVTFTTLAVLKASVAGFPLPMKLCLLMICQSLSI